MKIYHFYDRKFVCGAPIPANTPSGTGEFFVNTRHQKVYRDDGTPVAFGVDGLYRAVEVFECNGKYYKRGEPLQHGRNDRRAPYIVSDGSFRIGPCTAFAGSENCHWAVEVIDDFIAEATPPKQGYAILPDPPVRNWSDLKIALDSLAEKVHQEACVSSSWQVVMDMLGCKNYAEALVRVRQLLSENTSLRAEALKLKDQLGMLPIEMVQADEFGRRGTQALEPQDQVQLALRSRVGIDTGPMPVLLRGFDGRMTAVVKVLFLQGSAPHLVKSQKISAIQRLRALSGAGLREAKDAVDWLVDTLERMPEQQRIDLFQRVSVDG
jgi:hypothetical protein